MKIDNILNRLLAIKLKKDDLAKEEKKLKDLVDKQMADMDRLDVGGYAFIRETRQTKRYTLPGLRDVLKDEDLINSCLAPDNKLVKKIIKDAKISKEDIRLLEEKMEVVSESTSISLKKINTAT